MLGRLVFAELALERLKLGPVELGIASSPFGGHDGMAHLVMHDRRDDEKRDGGLIEYRVDDNAVFFRFVAPQLPDAPHARVAHAAPSEFAGDRAAEIVAVEGFEEGLEMVNFALGHQIAA